jgi:hypothetical protein
MAEGSHFSRMVRERMRHNGTGLRELCRAAELDPSFFSKVLADKRSPPHEEDALRRVAAALGLDARRLIVAAGRIPGEWRRLWTEDGLFEKVDELATASAAGRERPRKGRWEEPMRGLPGKKELEAELL